MKLFSAAALFATLAVALDTQSYKIIHAHDRHLKTEYWPEPMENKQAIAPPGWKRLGPVPANQTIELQISVAENEKALRKMLKWRGDPKSPWYGHDFTDEERYQIADYPEAPQEIRNWLSDYGIATQDDQFEPRVQWMKVNMTIAKAEELLHTHYRFFENRETKQQVIGTTEYSIPKNVTKYMDWLQPTFVGEYS